ncbi:DUF4350 domain-containing protein [Anatilimnocola floriformis]|uniref:DUF4350 domain-containing protein n=1 Tax=Anatilimnocola floriformis TaxID=2948575 RepID=UPI0020C548EC|nr:DUF4350 domain-containing protein [Anatilimnocola floriformis]
MSAAPTYHSTTEAAAGGNKWTLPAVLVGAVLLVAFLIWLFRSAPELETGYGRRMGNNYRASVNGTIVLSEMFRYSGRTVTSVDRLTPKLRKYQTIVWFPDDFGVPTVEQRQFFEQWLSEGSGRTLIYVGRDYDAATAYWTEIQADAPQDQLDEIKQKRSEAKSKFAEERARMPKEEFARWFVLRDGKARKVTTLAGPWADGIDAKQADISVSSQLDKPTIKDRPKDNKEELPEDFEPLLTSEKETLVARVTDKSWSDGQVIVVANGSMFLNYPLINHENRKLAGKLLDECDPDSQVAFLESGPGGPPIQKKSSEKQDREWPFPLNAIVFHLVMFSLVFCLARSAIFGRARELPLESPSDFGRHISALGKLMQRTKDQAYAYARLQQYRQHGKRDSGKSHKK